MNIICADTHEGYQSNLALTGHEFYALTHPTFKTWSEKNRPIPHNYHRVTSTQQLPEKIHCVISQNKLNQYELLSDVAIHYRCPLITIEHTIPPRGWSKEYTQKIGGMRGDIDVVNTRHSIDAWMYSQDDPNLVVISPGVDTSVFSGWIGGDGKAMTVVNDLAGRPDVVGYQVWQEIASRVPTNLWGINPGLSEETNGVDHLVDLYRHASVLFNPTLRASFGMVIIEAMSVGCPVVSTNNGPLPEIIIDGETGFLSNDTDVLIDKLMWLIKNPDSGRVLGSNGRARVVEMFSLERFVKQWSDLLETVL